MERGLKIVQDLLVSIQYDLAILRGGELGLNPNENCWNVSSGLLQDTITNLFSPGILTLRVNGGATEVPTDANDGVRE
jgi:hypothetical protein